MYTCICIHKYCLQSFLAEIKRLIKKQNKNKTKRKNVHLMCVEKRNTNKCVRSQQ